MMRVDEMRVCVFLDCYARQYMLLLQSINERLKFKFSFVNYYNFLLYCHVNM